ncbi:hypothetical protein ABH922_005592 [Rhodococcus sp. 27YEA15]|uniref:hypothetical protein n=1 Tax=Rhodococcus sp. 27YEA15 TaxID=3156259 RepID=UPI003C7E12F3
MSKTLNSLRPTGIRTTTGGHLMKQASEWGRHFSSTGVDLRPLDDLGDAAIRLRPNTSRQVYDVAIPNHAATVLP